MSIGIRKVFSEFLLVSAGKVISLGALFVCGVVVARFCGPAEFGRFSAALSVILLLDVALGGPLDYAAVRFSAIHRDEPDRVARFHGATFRIKAALLLLMLVAGLLGRAPLSGLLFSGQEGTWFLLLCIGATASLLLLRSCFAWLQTGMLFRQYATLDSLNGVLRIGAMIGVGLLGLRSAEAYIGVFAAAMAATYAGSLLLFKQPYLAAPAATRADFRALLGYFGATAAILIMGSFTGRSDIFFVKRLLSAEDAGLYASAAQVASAITMFASYACLVLQPRLMHAGEASIRRLALLSVGAGCAAAAVLMPASLWGGAWGLAHVFGAKYAPAAPVLTVLMIGACLDLVFMPVLMTYALQARAKASMYGEFVVTAAYIAAIGAFAERGLIAVACIATGTRALKLVLYTWLALTAQPPAGGVAAISGRSV